MQFFIPMQKLPTGTDQEKGFNTKTKQIYLKPNAKADRQKLRAYLSEHIPPEPLTEAIRIRVIWCFPVTGKHESGEPKISRPDTQNLCKGLYDVMTELGFWGDDSLICEEHLFKCYSATPGLFIDYSLIKKHIGEQRNDSAGNV